MTPSISYMEASTMEHIITHCKTCRVNQYTAQDYRPSGTRTSGNRRMARLYIDCTKINAAKGAAPDITIIGHIHTDYHNLSMWITLRMSESPGTRHACRQTTTATAEQPEVFVVNIFIMLASIYYGMLGVTVSSQVHVLSLATTGSPALSSEVLCWPN